MKTRKTEDVKIKFHRYNTVIVGAGAAGMDCAVHLCEFMKRKGIADPRKRIVVVTGGLGLGASRMSGSDKQTFYKMGTSPGVPDSAEEFAKTLTAAGCCHGDLALIEATGSLREFYHLVQAGVPFPTNSMGSFVGYKTDHDPSERATSAGPKTSKFMSEALQQQLEQYGVEIADNQEVSHLLTVGSGSERRIAGVVTFSKKSIYKKYDIINVYLGKNIVLAAGGPGELYEASVYPKGQFGIHGLAFKAGLAAENLTESQFGLASTKFRWNVSGTYMQAIPRVFSADANGEDQREFLTDYFPSMSKMATAIFLKGYQWPFDPQRIENHQSSLVDILVFNETQKGRSVFMDFQQNPIGHNFMNAFKVKELEPEVREYLEKAGALQKTPIERLLGMNPLAIEIYKEHGIDLHSEPLEIALCAQHNNGGFAVNKWWESNIAGTFVIGEMAGTHGVKRPGGSALNAGQVGGLRAAEYMANVYGCELPDYSEYQDEIDEQLDQILARFAMGKDLNGPMPKQVIKRIQKQMTASAGHIRELKDVRKALKAMAELYESILKNGISMHGKKELIWAIRAENMVLTSIAFLKAVSRLLELGGGSRGSHLVVAGDGIEIHPDIIAGAAGKTLKFKPEDNSLRDAILRVEYDDSLRSYFRCDSIKLRAVPGDRKAFEPAWRDFREGKIYSDDSR